MKRQVDMMDSEYQVPVQKYVVLVLIFCEGHEYNVPGNPPGARRHSENQSRKTGLQNGM